MLKFMLFKNEANAPNIRAIIELLASIP